VIRAKVIPFLPIKFIAGEEIGAMTIFLVEEKADGKDISPLLDALMQDE
jgi:hypothetical protein